MQEGTVVTPESSRGIKVGCRMFLQKAPPLGTRPPLMWHMQCFRAGRLQLVHPCTPEKTGICFIHLPFQRAFSKSFSRETVCEGVEWSEGSRGMGVWRWRFCV